MVKYSESADEELKTFSFLRICLWHYAAFTCCTILFSTSEVVNKCHVHLLCGWREYKTCRTTASFSYP